jgi:hypothetical protein
MDYLTSVELERQATESRTRAEQAGDQGSRSWYLSAAASYETLARQAATWEQTGHWPPRSVSS